MLIAYIALHSACTARALGMNRDKPGPSPPTGSTATDRGHCHRPEPRGLCAMTKVRGRHVAVSGSLRCCGPSRRRTSRAIVNIMLNWCVAQVAHLLNQNSKRLTVIIGIAKAHLFSLLKPFQSLFSMAVWRSCMDGVPADEAFR